MAAWMEPLHSEKLRIRWQIAMPRSLGGPGLHQAPLAGLRPPSPASVVLAGRPTGFAHSPLRYCTVLYVPFSSNQPQGDGMALINLAGLVVPPRRCQVKLA